MGIMWQSKDKKIQKLNINFCKIFLNAVNRLAVEVPAQGCQKSLGLALMPLSN